jgi:FkbM family methyltransferase
MKLFGRDIKQYRGQIKELHKYLWYLLKCFSLFKHPFDIIYAYIRQQLPKNNPVEFRDGTKILLSDHPHDIITVFVVFVRQDYGQIPGGNIVIDIGANIGVFALYAARCKAKKVYAFEPNSESYQLLLRNIELNNLPETILAFQSAIYKNDGEKVAFPRSGSMYSAIIQDINHQDYEWVDTITLNRIAGQICQTGETIDLVKLDCEGAEYDALFACSDETFKKIQAIKLEYHKGALDVLTSLLQTQGFQVTKLMVENEQLGNLWVEKSR